MDTIDQPSVQPTVQPPVQPAAASQPSEGRRFMCGSSRVAFVLLLLAVIAGGIVLIGRIAIQDRHTATAQTAENASRVEMDFRLATPAGSRAGSLREILAHPEFIPTHNHPLVGRRAPDFELVDLDGKTWSLKKLLADGPVVLIFYHTFCDMCDRQLFTDNGDLPLFRQLGARLVAISADPPAVTRQRFMRFGLFGFPVLSDPGNKVAQAYHVFRRDDGGPAADRLLHGTFIIDRRGTVRWVNIGDAPFRSNRVLLSVLARTEGRLPPLQPEP